MARKAKSRPPVRPSADDQRPPLEPAPLPPGTSTLSPISKGVEQDAQRLIHQAGSPSLAKQAVDQAAKREAIPEFRQDLFAQRWGFNSRQEFLAASHPVMGAQRPILVDNSRRHTALDRLVRRRFVGPGHLSYRGGGEGVDRPPNIVRGGAVRIGVVGATTKT